MNPFEAVESRLVADQFPSRVAIFPNNLPDLGDVLEVHAFDIPEDRLLEVSQRLNGLLAAMRLTPMAIGMAFFEGESAQAESKLPSGAVWLRPERRLASVSTLAPAFPLPASFLKLVGAGAAGSRRRWTGRRVRLAGETARRGAAAALCCGGGAVNPLGRTMGRRGGFQPVARACCRS